MNFLNPWMLLGLLAAGIPILLHLLNLRKLKTIEFSTLRFLKELQKTRIRRFKIKQIILLILRTLIIIFAALAFARPVVNTSLPFANEYARTSAVVLLDNSFSMEVSDEFGERRKQAINATKHTLSTLKEGDEAAIITLCETINPNTLSFSRSPSFLETKLSEIKTSPVPASLENGLRYASVLMQEANNLNREIYIISDAQQNIINKINLDSTKFFKNNLNLYFIKIGGESSRDIKNLSVDSINIITKVFELGKPVEVEALVKNHSKEDAQNIVVSMLYNGKRVAQRNITIPAGEIRNVNISAPAQSPGLYRMTIEIEKDALEADNRRFSAFIIPTAPRIALFAEKAVSNFLNTAFKMSENTKNVYVFNPEQISSVDFADYDVIFASLPFFRQSDIARLQKYIEQGGAAFLFPGADPADMAFINDIKTLGIDLGEPKDYKNKPAKFQTVDKLHPLFEGVFQGSTDSRAIVESPDIRRAIPAKNGFPLIEMEGGSFLSEIRTGHGRFFYCAVSPDFRWGNFPTTGIFFAIVHRAAAYLSAKESFGANIVAGENYMLKLPGKYASGGNFRISDPNNNDFFIQAATLPSGAVLTLEGLNTSGVYAVHAQDNSVVTFVTVNNAPSESLLHILKNEEIEQGLSPRMHDDTKIHFIEDSRNIREQLKRARTGAELWKFFVMLAIVTAIAEIFVAKNAKSDGEDIKQV